jgi:hypothetical protein
VSAGFVVGGCDALDAFCQHVGFVEGEGEADGGVQKE